MDKFDFNSDGFVVKEELKEAGCVVFRTIQCFDKNDDGKLSKKELRKALEYIVRHRCPRD